MNPSPAPLVAADSAADAGAFLARVRHLDPGAVVRLCPAGEGAVALWVRLPFGVLVTRRVRSTFDEDATVGVADLMATLAREGRPAPLRRDTAWRGQLPPDSGEVLEEVPAADVRRIAAAAADTLRARLGGAVGERRLRDALLDHVAIVVTDPAGAAAEVPVRVVQALVRMGFLGDDAVRVRRARGGWLGAEATYGAAWYRPEPPMGLLL